jgi:hypothetical protein
LPANLVGGDRGAPIPDPVGGRDAYAFAVCGDIEGGSATFRDILRRAREEGAEFMLVAGDLAHRTLSNWLRWFARDVRLSGFDLPVLVVAGNHDESDWPHGRRDPTIYRQLFGASPYAFRCGPDLFVGLDTVRWSTDPKEREGLERLAGGGPGRRHLFAFGHHPARPVGKKKFGPKARARGLEEGLTRAGTAIYFAGHKHSYHRMEGEGFLQIVTGRGGTYDKEGILPNHFVLVRVSPGGIEDRRVDVPRTRESLGERCGFAGAVRVYHFWGQRPWLGFIAGAAVGAWAIFGLARLRRACQPPDGSKRA